MTLKERISAFAELGLVLVEAASDSPGSAAARDLRSLMERQETLNKWFTPANVAMAVGAIGSMLSAEKLEKWVSRYDLPDNRKDPGKVGVVMAGNIPLVGFHDLLSVLVSGHRLIARTSSKDPELINHITAILLSIDQRFAERIAITGGTFGKIDAVIATGSDNSARYFEYYFGKYPHIFRRNRNSVAVIRGDESAGQLSALGNDIFSYFGLGCRNVSKLMLPSGYEAGRLPRSWERWKSIASHSGYSNNLDHHKALFIINRLPFIDGGIILLREDNSLSSQVGVLNFEFYRDEASLYETLKREEEKIQVIVGERGIKFGFSQYPEPWDYADGRDILHFLNSI